MAVRIFSAAYFVSIPGGDGHRESSERAGKQPDRSTASKIRDSWWKGDRE